MAAGMAAVLLAFVLSAPATAHRMQVAALFRTVDQAQEAASATACQVTGYIFDVPGMDSQSQQHLPSHVVLETPKPVKAGLRAIIQNSSAAAFRRPRVTFVSFATSAGLETSPHGTPTIRSMFEAALAKFPKADTYTYFNSDIAVDGSFVATADAVARAVQEKTLRNRFLVVGRRTNVDWHESDKLSDATFEERFKKGSLFQPTAQDYFMVSQKSFDWSSIPAFIVGHRGYDNWLVDKASHDPGMDVVDASQTLRAMHMTDPQKGNFEGLHNPDDGRVGYNMHLMGKAHLNSSCTLTNSTQWETRLSQQGEINFIRRSTFCNEHGLQSAPASPTSQGV